MGLSILMSTATGDAVREEEAVTAAGGGGQGDDILGSDAGALSEDCLQSFWERRADAQRV